MDFALSEEHRMFQRMLRDFTTKELEPLAAKLDEDAEFSWKNVKKIAQLGLLGLTIDEKYDGSGGDSIHLVIASKELARACASTCTTWLASLSLGTSAIYKYGNEEQLERFIPPLAKGERIAAFGLTEPAAGSDVASLETTAIRRGEDWVLNGTKVFITNGSVAETVVVFATIDKALRSRGITAFIVEKGTPGYSVGKEERKLGIRASSTSELVFEDCAVLPQNLLGEEGRGMRLALDIIDGSRIVIAGQALGIAQAALEASLAYAKQRQQFGQPIAQFQAIQWMLADIATSLDAAELLTYRAAYLKDKGLPFVKEAAMAKLFASEMAMAATTKAIQILGGYGYTKDYPLERYFRDAKITEIYEGTSEMQRWTIARNLLQDSP